MGETYFQPVRMTSLRVPMEVVFRVSTSVMGPQTAPTTAMKSTVLCAVRYDKIRYDKIR